MIVYILMLIISVVFMYCSNKTDKKWLKIIFEILSIIPLFLVSAFRFEVGTDYSKRYVSGYNYIAKGLGKNRLETAFVILVKICLLITKDSSILFGVTSFIIIFSIMGVIIYKSENKILSLLIFILGGFYFESLNLIRQYISVGLLLIGMIFLLKENWKINCIYIVFVLLASTFHTSAIFAIPLIFLNKKNFSNWKWIIPVCGSIIIFHNIINTVIIEILNHTSYNFYNDVSGQISILFILKNLIVFMFYEIVYNQNKKNNNIQNADNLFINIQALNLIIICLGACNYEFSRLAVYFNIFQIISIPYFISKINYNDFEQKLDKILKNKKLNLKAITDITVVCFFTILFLYTNVLHNDNEVIPYKTVLNKNIYITNYKIENVHSN